MACNANRCRGGRFNARPGFLLPVVWRAGITALVLVCAGSGQPAAAPAEDLVSQCTACHGDGERPPQTPETPILAGQPELYALYQLVFFRQGQRRQEVMSDLVKDLKDDDLRDLAKWIAGLPPPPPAHDAPDAARFQHGAEIARSHRCPICHAPDLAGHEHVPRLAGQQEAYLLKALQDYKTGRRVGIQAAMAEVLSEIDADGLADLAHYLAHVR